MYLVHATRPSKFSNKGWTFKGDYFPRKIRYKKEALELAEQARQQGGSGVRVEKLKNGSNQESAGGNSGDNGSSPTAQGTDGGKSPLAETQPIHPEPGA